MPTEEYEYSISVPSMYIEPNNDPAIVICISAVGGGTVGEAYANNGWEYAVFVNKHKIITGEYLHSAVTVPSTHADMAVVLAYFLSTAGESLHYSGPDSAYADEYPAGRLRDFLVSEYERLNMFAYDSENSDSDVETGESIACAANGVTSDGRAYHYSSEHNGYVFDE